LKMRQKGIIQTSDQTTMISECHILIECIFLLSRAPQEPRWANCSDVSRRP
jgi:hypothetical protein